MRHLFFSTFFLMLGFCSLNAQTKKYLEGFIVMDNNDTIRGKLQILSEEKKGRFIILINSANEELKFTDDNVVSYKIGDDLYFRKLIVRPNQSDGVAFMKLLIKGAINLYEFKYTSAGMGPTSFSYSYTTDYYMEKESQFVFVKRQGFKNSMITFLNDDIELCDKIANKTLKYKNIQEIVNQYNATRIIID